MPDHRTAVEPHRPKVYLFYDPIDVLLGNVKQAVERMLGRLAQSNHGDLLRRTQRRMSCMSQMRVVL